MFMQIIEIFLSVLCMSVVGVTGDEPTNPLDKAQELTAMQALVEQAAPEKVTAEEAQATATEQNAEAPAAEATAESATKVSNEQPINLVYTGNMNDWGESDLTYNEEEGYFSATVSPKSTTDQFYIKEKGETNKIWYGPIYYDKKYHGKCIGNNSGQNLVVPSENEFQLCVKYINDDDVTIYVNRTPEIDLYYTGDMLSPAWHTDTQLNYSEKYDFYTAEITPITANDEFKIKGPGIDDWTINWGIAEGQKIAYDEKNRSIFEGVFDKQNINIPSAEPFRVYVRYFTATEADIYVNVEPSDPATRKVSMNLNGGDITDEEKATAKSQGWGQIDYPTSDNYIKYVKIGLSYNMAATPWHKIHPEKQGAKCTGWSPSISDEGSYISDDIVFNAMYVEPVHTQWEVSVDLGQGRITETQEKMIIEQELWQKDSSSKTPVYTKLFDDGTTYADAMKAWKEITPTSEIAGGSFKGWSPELDETEIHKNTEFFALYDQPAPSLINVTVNLNGGAITTAEAKYIASKGWEAAAGAGDSLYVKGFEAGKIYKDIMADWNTITPTATSGSFTGWDPTPGAQKLEKATTFKAIYEESPVPITYTVKVDLNGGSITDEEAASLETAGWKTTKFFNTPIYTKDFDEGTTYSKIMELWLLIEPTKDGKDFNGWDPHPGTTKLEAPITFKAQYTDTPQPQQFEVAVYLNGGTVTAKEEIALIDDGWKSTNVFSDNPSYTKLIDEGTTYIQAMAIWAYISPSKTDYKFSGWLPELGSQTLDADTGFTAQYQSDQPEPGPTPDPDPDDPTTPVNVLAGLVQTADNLPPAAIALIFFGTALCVMVIAFASKKNEAHNIN